MDSLINFLSTGLASVCAIFNDFFAGSTLFVVLCALIVIPLYNKNIKNLYICEIVKDQYNEARNGKGGSDRASLEVLVSHGYSAFCGYIAVSLQFLLALFYGLATRGGAMSEFVVSRFAIAMSRTPIELYKLREAGISYVTGFLFVVYMLEYYIIVRSESMSLINDRRNRMIILYAMILLAFVVPIGYCYSLFVSCICEFIHFKLYTGSLKEKRMAKIQEDMVYDVKAYESHIKSYGPDKSKNTKTDKKTEPYSKKKKIKKLKQK